MAQLQASDGEIDGAIAERFGDLRVAIAAHLRSGQNIDEVRFMLRRYFAQFVVRDTLDGRVILAELRDGLVDEVMADLAGVKREALRLLTTAHDGLLMEEPEPCSRRPETRGMACGRSRGCVQRRSNQAGIRGD
jgi:hypothetical protein